MVDRTVRPRDEKRETRRHCNGIMAELRCRNSRSALQLTASLSALAALFFWALSLLESHFAGSLAIAVAIGLLNVRIFNLMHDCSHASYFTSRRANDWAGSLLGALTLTPFAYWRYHHLRHHGTSGNLDRRGQGDILMYTLEEYKELPALRRLHYRLYRNPFVFLTLGPVLYFAVRMRNPALARRGNAERKSIHGVNLFWIAVYGALFAVGVDLGKAFAVHALSALVGGSIGLWLFFVQHQFEMTYWRRSDDWDFRDAALAGSSHVRLPRVFEWLFVHINVHHAHHIDPKIPNYRLKESAGGLPGGDAKGRELSLSEALSAFRVKLWDEEKGMMTGFPR